MSTHILIDYENVSICSIQGDRSRKILSESDTLLKIFLGPSQTKIPTRLILDLQELYSKYEFFHLPFSGKNALDFLISYHIGGFASCNEGDRDARYFIVSKDSGFDPLLEWMRARGFNAMRTENIEKIPHQSESFEQALKNIGKEFSTPCSHLIQAAHHPENWKEKLKTLDPARVKALRNKAEIDQLINFFETQKWARIESFFPSSRNGIDAKTFLGEAIIELKGASMLIIYSEFSALNPSTGLVEVARRLHIVKTKIMANKNEAYSESQLTHAILSKRRIPKDFFKINYPT